MKYLALALLLSLPAAAQDVQGLPQAGSGDLTLGGVPQLIADKLKETKPCGLVNLSGKMGGGAYLPIITFHDKSGINYAEAADIGYRAIQGAAPSVMVMPLAVNVTALSGRFWDFQWSRDHVTRSKFPPVYLGVTAVVPINGPDFQRLKWSTWRDWSALVASVRFQ